MGLTGRVRNNNEGVRIEVICTDFQINNFIKSIKTEKPDCSYINDIFINERPLDESFSHFRIEASNLVSA